MGIPRTYVLPFKPTDEHVEISDLVARSDQALQSSLSPAAGQDIGELQKGQGIGEMGQNR